MDDEAAKPKGKGRKAMVPLTQEDAQARVLKKLAGVGPKGSATPHAKVADSSPDAAIYRQALALLANEKSPEIFVDRRKPKPRYYLWVHRPSLPSTESVAARLLSVVQASHPRVFAEKGLFAATALGKEEKPLGPAALQFLLDRGQLISLQYAAGKKVHQIYTTAEVASVPKSNSPARPALRLDALRPAYDALVRQTGFPAVPISALQKATHVPLDGLKELLRQERDAGSVSLSIGDWSMASEEERLGVIEMHGRRYLQVRWEI